VIASVGIALQRLIAVSLLPAGNRLVLALRFLEIASATIILACGSLVILAQPVTKSGSIVLDATIAEYSRRRSRSNCALHP
jgi:hypothetical protein